MGRIKPTDNTIYYIIFGFLMLCIISSITSTTGGTYYVIQEIDPYEHDFSNYNLDDENKVLNYCQTRGICFDGLIGWYDLISFNTEEYSWYDKSRHNNTLILNRQERDYKAVLEKIKTFVVTEKKEEKKDDDKVDDGDISLEEKLDNEYSLLTSSEKTKFDTDEKERLDLSSEEIDVLKKELDVTYKNITINDLKKRVKKVYDDIQQEKKDIVYLNELAAADEKFSPDEVKISRYKKLFNITTWDISLLSSYQDKVWPLLDKIEKTLYTTGGRVTGTPLDTIEFPENMFTENDNYTFIHVSNYVEYGGRNQRIFQASDINYVSGFHKGKTGISFQDPHWVNTDSSTGTIGYGDNQSILSIEHKGQYTMNNDPMSTVKSGVAVPKKVAVNVGTHPGEYGDFQIAEMLVYNRKLTDTEIDVVRKYLTEMYYI
jgi:hypothetical protein